MRRLLAALLVVASMVPAISACGGASKPATVATAQPTPPADFVLAVTDGGYVVTKYQIENSVWEASTNVDSCKVELDQTPKGYVVEEIGNLDKANKVLRNPTNMPLQQLRKALGSLSRADRKKIGC